MHQIGFITEVVIALGLFVWVELYEKASKEIS